MSDKVTISRAAELEALPGLRQFIAEAGQARGLSAEVIFNLQLAVDEAATNVITHGYAGRDPGSLIVELRFDARQVVLTLTDFGQPFEPSAAPTPDLAAALEDRPTGGLGLFFIYSVMDEVDYRADEGGNRLILTKRL